MAALLSGAAFAGPCDVAPELVIKGDYKAPTDAPVKKKRIVIEAGARIQVPEGATAVFQTECLTLNGAASFEGRGRDGRNGARGRNGNGGGWKPGCRVEELPKCSHGHPRWNGSGGASDCRNTQKHSCDNADDGQPGENGRDGGNVRFEIATAQGIRANEFAQATYDLKGGAPGNGGAGGLGMHRNDYKGKVQDACLDGQKGADGKAGQDGACNVLITATNERSLCTAFK